MLNLASAIHCTDDLTPVFEALSQLCRERRIKPESIAGAKLACHLFDSLQSGAATTDELVSAGIRHLEMHKCLARWLLRHRTEDDRIATTHGYLAIMPGLGRPGVTNSLQVLEGEGFITSLRGEIIIRDRQGLLQFADDAYDSPKEEAAIRFASHPRPALCRSKPDRPNATPMFTGTTALIEPRRRGNQLVLGKASP